MKKYLSVFFLIFACFVYANEVFIIEVKTIKINNTLKPDIPDDLYKETISIAINYSPDQKTCALVIEVKDKSTKDKIINKYFNSPKIEKDENKIIQKNLYKDIDKWILVQKKLLPVQ